MSVKHVLFIETNAAEIGPHKRPTGYFFPEVAHPFEVCDRAGIAVEYASPLGGTPPNDGYDDTDPAQCAIARAWNARMIVAAVCPRSGRPAGRQAGGWHPLVRGRKLTSFSNEEEAGYAQADVPFLLEDALRAEGAEHVSAAPWQPKVVVGGRLMTDQSLASAGPLAEAIIEALCGDAR